MKSSLVIGILFLILGGSLAYIQYNGSNDPFLTFTLIIGILFGGGLGLIFGAIGGYNSKSKNIKKKEIKQQQEIHSRAQDTSSYTSSDSSSEV